MKIIPLKYDFCVKEIMENEIVRKHFISDVLSIPLRDIRSVRILNPFLWKRYKRQKLGILDIQLELNNDAKINIEIQLRQMRDWKKRSVFYLAKMFTADLRRGEDYEKAKRCIVISILDFEPADCVSADYHNVYMLRDKYGNLYTDVLELHTIELKKKPCREQPRPLDEWHSLFNAKTEEDLEMLKSGTKNLGIMEAIKELKEISLSDRLRYEHEMRLKAKRDRRAEDSFIREQGIEIGKSQGIEIGKSQGIEIGKSQSLNILINILRKNGLSDEQIAQELAAECGLSREEALDALHSGGLR
ncbi:MAG: Rpn family recombination-promoting nuclease/putative transposase [Lachnospiraceae bacterium]|nr:Rpn family recombination-promoting nuclease/putative transposase [Lachnospiraceae bacterium]